MSTANEHLGYIAFIIKNNVLFLVLDYVIVAVY